MKDTKEKLFYPENAYYDIWGEKMDIPADAEESLKYVMETLTPREADIFMFNFRDEMSLSEIGEKYIITKERVRQILAKALRKLRHPQRTKILSIGREAYLNTIVVANEEKLQQYNDRIGVLETLIQKQNEKIAECQVKITDLDRQTDSSFNVLNMSIEDLDLSVRSFNCLSRAGLETIKEVLTHECLYTLRNLGRRSFIEIQNRIKTVIYSVKEQVDYEYNVNLFEEMISRHL